MKHLILLLTIFILTSACTAKKKAGSTVEESKNKCNEMILLEKPSDSLRFDHYGIDSLYIKDQCMEVVVNYSGGCGESEFKLYYTNRIMESMPPKTVLYLTFEDNDPCRSIVRKGLKFSLEPFKRFDDGGIYFKIYGTDKSVLYQVPK